MKKFLPLLAIVLLCANALATTFPDISLAELKAAIGTKKVTLLDVNGPVSYASGHIPGAIDFTAHTADLASVLPAVKRRAFEMSAEGAALTGRKGLPLEPTPNLVAD